jgi:hypothetical protein
MIKEAYKFNTLRNMQGTTTQPNTENIPGRQEQPGALKTSRTAAGTPAAHSQASLVEHVQQLGSSQWARTGQALLEHNKVFGQTFTMMSKFLKVYETQKNSWLSAAINWHSLGKMFPLTEMERQELDRLNVYSV